MKPKIGQPVVFTATHFLSDKPTVYAAIIEAVHPRSEALALMHPDDENSYLVDVTVFRRGSTHFYGSCCFTALPGTEGSRAHWSWP